MRRNRSNFDCIEVHHRIRMTTIVNLNFHHIN